MGPCRPVGPYGVPVCPGAEGTGILDCGIRDRVSTARYFVVFDGAPAPYAITGLSMPE